MVEQNYYIGTRYKVLNLIEYVVMVIANLEVDTFKFIKFPHYIPFSYFYPILEITKFGLIFLPKNGPALCRFVFKNFLQR